MTQQIQKRFSDFIEENHLFSIKNKILLAVSGGADSMALCDLFLQSGIKIGIAHCNFKLRGKESERDEIFVREYALKQGVPLHQIRFDTEEYAETNKLSIEEAARNLRYSWFEEIRKENLYDFIATAHHMNDNVETLLFHLFRGTGLKGLHGIRPKRGKIIRPLLFLSKKEILDYLQARKLTFVEDRTNKASEFTRNYIRNEILPVIEERFPDVVQNMGKSIDRFSEAEEIYNQHIEETIRKVVEKRGPEIFIPIRKLLKLNPLHTMVYEIFKTYHFGHKQTGQILEMATSSSAGKILYSPSHRLLKDRKWFIISPKEQQKNTYLTLEKGEKTVENEVLKLSFEVKSAENYQIYLSPEIAAVDYDKIQFPLIVRNWKEGDYFYPLGMRKKKKVGHFFIDQKLSLAEKEKTCLLFSADRLVWVIGKRIDDRFKITATTKKILEIKFQSKL